METVVELETPAPNMEVVGDEGGKLADQLVFTEDIKARRGSGHLSREGR